MHKVIKSFNWRPKMCALVTTKHSATKVAGGDASEILDDLKRIGVRFVVGGSHAYREKLSNNYKPRDLDIVVFWRRKRGCCKRNVRGHFSTSFVVFAPTIIPSSLAVQFKHLSGILISNRSKVIKLFSGY
jgi:hypothetical protein